MHLRPTFCTSMLVMALALAASVARGIAAAEFKPDGPSEAEAEALIRNLGDEDFGVRQAATQALFPHARACWTRLQAAARSSEAEVCERAQKILAACFREQLKTLITREKVLLAMARVESRTLLPPLTEKYKELEYACDGYQWRVTAAETEFESARGNVHYRIRDAIREKYSLGSLPESELTEGMKKRLAKAKAEIADADREVDGLKAALEASRGELDRSKAADEAAKAEAFEALKRTRIEREIQEAVLASRINLMEEAMADATAAGLLGLAAPPEKWDPEALPWELRVKAPLFVPGVCATVRSAARIFEQTTGIPVEVRGQKRSDCELARGSRPAGDPASAMGLPGGELARAEKFLADIAGLPGVTVEIDRPNARVRIEIHGAE